MKYAVASLFCDWVVGVCDATTTNIRNMRSMKSRKIVRVYNGVVPLRRAAQDNCPPKNGFTLLYVGRLEPIKNHSLLLRAFHIALSSMPGLRLWMVGDGSERKSLEGLASALGIAEQVTFWGQQSDVAPFLSCADVFTMSSKSEGLPLSLLQGFSLGVPAIVTDVGGMGEVVRLAKAGLIVSRENAAEMADAIVAMAGDEAARKRFSDGGLAAFRSQFSLNTMVDAYLKLYTKKSA